MASVTVASARRATARRAAPDPAALAVRGGVALYLGVIVALPLAALGWFAVGGGLSDFWEAISEPQAVAALKLTISLSIGVTAVNAIVGTAVAWVLVRDDFRGKWLVDGVVDLPFALPTIVSG